MINQAIITALLSTGGILIVIWAVLATSYLLRRNKFYSDTLVNHDGRIQSLELNMVEQVVKSEEMLDDIQELKSGS